MVNSRNDKVPKQQALSTMSDKDNNKVFGIMKNDNVFSQRNRKSTIDRLSTDQERLHNHFGSH